MSAVLCAVDEGLTRDAIQSILGKFNIQCLWQPADSQIEFQAADPESSAALVDASINPKQVVELIHYIRVVSDLPILAVIKENQDQELADLLGASASDFVMIPLRSEELMLHLQILLMRRNQCHENETMEFLRCEGLVLDIQDHRVWKMVTSCTTLC